MPTLPTDLTTLEALAIACIIGLAGVISVMFWRYDAAMQAENGYLRQMVEAMLHTTQDMSKAYASLTDDMAEVRRALMERKR